MVKSVFRFLYLFLLHELCRPLFQIGGLIFHVFLLPITDISGISCFPLTRRANSQNVQVKLLNFKPLFAPCIGYLWKRQFSQLKKSVPVPSVSISYPCPITFVTFLLRVWHNSQTYISAANYIIWTQRQ